MRETVKFTTQSGVEVEVNSYVTGREMRTVSLCEEKEKSLDEMVRFSIVSINGEKEDIINKVLDLRGSDYVEVIEKASALFDISDQKKTN